MCYSIPVKQNLHPHYLLVKRWAAKIGLTLDDLHDDLGSRSFAQACGIGDYPVGVVEQIRVDTAVHRAPLVVIAESRGYSVARFIRENWAWLKQFYCLTKSDAPEEQEGWVADGGYQIRPARVEAEAETEAYVQSALDDHLTDLAREKEREIAEDRLYDQAHA
jgi:hypothetical protein